jgi:prepilin-type N-terminal cleavage/methylation domain-containing protein
VDDRGYTLAEMLAALMIVGLVIGGVAGGVTAAARLQRQGAERARAAESAAALANGLTALLREQGPFSSAGGVKLAGDRRGFSFACAGGGACSAAVGRGGRAASILLVGPGRNATIRWPGWVAPTFEYIGSKTTGDHWPPDNPTDWQRLRAVAVTDAGSDVPLATVRIWVEAPSEGAGGSPAGGQAGGAS